MHKKYIDLIYVAHITESVGCGHLEEIRFDATSTRRHRIDVTPISQQGPSSSKQVPFPPKHHCSPLHHPEMSIPLTEI